MLVERERLGLGWPEDGVPVVVCSPGHTVATAGGRECLKEPGAVPLVVEDGGGNAPSGVVDIAREVPEQSRRTDSLSNNTRPHRCLTRSLVFH